MSKRFAKLLMLVSLLLVLAIATAVFFPIFNPMTWKHMTRLAEIEARIREENQPLFFSDLSNAPKSQIEIGNQAFEAAKQLKIGQDVSTLLSEALEERKQLTPEQLELVRREIKSIEEPLNRLEAINDACSFEYDFNTTSPWEIYLPEVQEISYASRAIGGRFLVAIEDNNRDEAVRCVVELFETSDLLENAPFFVTQHSRIRCGKYGIFCIERLLSQVAISNSQLISIDQKLADAERRFRLQSVVMTERAMLNTQFGQVGKFNTYKLKKLVKWGDSWNGFPVAPDVDAMWYPSGALEQRCWALETIGVQAELIDQMPWQAQSQWQELETSIDSYVDNQNPIGQIYPAITSLRDLGLSYRQRLVNTRLALRVASFYRAQNQSLPESLEPIIDEAIRPAVTATWNGKLPQYLNSQDSFEIFSSDFPSDDRTPTSVKIDFQ